MLKKLRSKLRRRKKEVAKVKSDPEGFAWHSCKNCDYKFEGNFCPSCGQSVKEVQKPVRFFFGDMLDSLLVFDLRVVRSLPTLLIKPGKISSDYIAGKRRRYVPPFRFFLFASILFFFLIGLQTRNLFNTNLDGEQSEALVDSVFQEMKDRGQINESGDTVMAISNLREGLGMYEYFKEVYKKELSDSTLTDERRAKTTRRLQSMENPNYITSQIYKYISWSFFILMPFYALILRVFFRKKRKYYVEHLVFSVNLHTFYFILLSIVVLIGIIFENLLKGMGPWIVLLAFIYAMVGIRNFYSKRWISSFFYTILTFFLYLISSIILLFAGTMLVLVIIGN